MDAKTKAADVSDRELKIVRVINAPVEKVWNAMTDMKQVAQWWGPNGFRTTIEKMDFRVGGEWKHVMHGPDGTDYPNYSKFVEIVKHERIVYRHSGHETNHLFVGTWVFEKVEGNKTKLTLSMVFDQKEERDKIGKYATDGANETLNRLELFTKGEVIPFFIVRTFKAPRELVWKCWTEPERLKEWAGPKGGKTLKADMDFRVGGRYHYCLSYAGHEIWGKQVFREIKKPEKLVYVNAFSDAKGGLGRHPMSPTWPAEMLTTVTFTEEHKTKTKVTIEWVPINSSSEENRTFDSGRDSMTQGWGGSLEQLTDYLKKA